jgi:hypothetical protein
MSELEDAKKVWHGWGLGDSDSAHTETLLSIAPYPNRKRVPLMLTHRLPEGGMVTRPLAYFRNPADAWTAMKTIDELIERIVADTLASEHGINREAVWIAMQRAKQLMKPAEDGDGRG